MNTKGYPQHLIKVVQSLYKNTSISIDNGSNSSTYEIINQGVRQGRPISPNLFNIYIDAAMDEWQSKLRTNFRLGKMILNTLMFAYDQVIFAQSENELQMTIQLLNKTTLNYNLEISINKSTVMAYSGKYTVRSKIMIKIKS
jgi:hypothetical protein